MKLSTIYQIKKTFIPAQYIQFVRLVRSLASLAIKGVVFEVGADSSDWHVKVAWLVLGLMWLLCDALLVRVVTLRSWLAGPSCDMLKEQGY